MISPIDQEYKLTKLIKQGKAKMNPDFTQLADWIDRTYGVKTMNIIYDKIDNNTRPRLNIVFEKENEEELFAKGFEYDEVKRHEITSQFISVTDPHKYETNNLLVIFSAFEPIAKIEAYWNVPKDEIQKLQLELNIRDIWLIRQNTWEEPTVFFYTIEQAEQYAKNGTKKMLAKKCFELFKKQDEFGYLKEKEFSIHLDSKENFENYYKSSWFNYDRR